jgi:thioesterase domain-containing protein
VSREREYVYPDNDWSQFAPALDVCEVPGDHDGMVLAPNVSVLGKEIRDLLATTNSRATRPHDSSKAAE